MKIAQSDVNMPALQSSCFTLQVTPARAFLNQEIRQDTLIERFSSTLCGPLHSIVLNFILHNTYSRET